MHVAHGHSTHAEAFTLLKFYPGRRTHPGIHSAAIMPSHSSIILRTHPSSCSQYLRAYRQWPMRPCACALSYAGTHGRAPEFLSLQSAHCRAALFDRARRGRQADPDEARKDIVLDLPPSGSLPQAPSLPPSPSLLSLSQAPSLVISPDFFLELTGFFTGKHLIHFLVLKMNHLESS